MTSRIPARAKTSAMAVVRGAVRPIIVHSDRLPAPVRAAFRQLRNALPYRLRRALAPRAPYVEPARLPDRPPVPDTPIRLLIGPANFAGQGWQWARAVEREVPGVGAESYAFSDGALDFPTDYVVPIDVYARSQRWQEDQERHVLASYTHVLIEAGRPVFGTRYGSTCARELRVLRRAGIEVALLSHGSDLRIPSRHARTYVDSPFHDTSWESVPILERTAARNAKLFNSFDGYTFVSTLDLLDYAPRAIWCPGVVDVEAWATDTVALERPVPVVAHAPSKGRLKGSQLIDPIMQELDRRGIVEYRRIERVQPRDMPAVYKDADIVIDQFTMGIYGVAACEAMAAGRVVVSFVGDTVRARARKATGRELPIVEATPGTLVEVVEKLLDDRDAARDFAAAGPSYVWENHDGRRSALALAPFLTGARRD